MARVLVLLWGVLLLPASVGAAQAAPAPAVLVVTFEAEPVVRPWEQAWLDAGYQVKAVQHYRQVNWDLLRQFNLLVVTPPLNYNLTGQDHAPWVAQPEEVAALSALMSRFLEQGGGILFYGNCSNTTQPPAVETLLQPYAANALFEKATDPDQTYQQPGRARQSFSFTANVVLGDAWADAVPGENDQCALRIDNEQVKTGSLAPAFGWAREVKAGGYYAISPGPLTNSAVMLLDDGYLMNGTARAPTWNRGYVGVGVPGTQYKAGTDLDLRWLAVVTGMGGPPNTEQVEWVHASLGIVGDPAYTVKPTQGQVKGTRFFLDLQAQDGGFTGVISQARLPLSRLPIRVYGLSPHWSAGVYDRRRKELLPFGFTDGVGYASVNTRTGDSDVYLGNLATCNNPDLRLWVVEDGPNRITVTAHNPTDREIAAAVKRGAGYDRVPAFEKAVTVPAGSSVSFGVGG